MWPLPRTALWRKQTLRHAGIDHYFRGLITVAEVGVGKKESAEIYERAMRRLQSNKKDTVVFEDAFHAIQTAKAAGFRVAAVYDASEEAHRNVGHFLRGLGHDGACPDGQRQVGAVVGRNNVGNAVQKRVLRLDGSQRCGYGHKYKPRVTCSGRSAWISGCRSFPAQTG